MRKVELGESGITEGEITREPMETQRAADKRSERREKVLREFGKYVKQIDGLEAQELRQWLRDVASAGDLAEASREEIIRFALANSTSVLRELLTEAYRR
jgi:hypothetical protein